jgi:hypothetical protein
MLRSGLEAVFIDEAVGHTRADRRSAILHWLIYDYELKTWNTEQAVAYAHSLLC